MGHTEINSKYDIKCNSLIFYKYDKAFHQHGRTYYIIQKYIMYWLSIHAGIRDILQSGVRTTQALRLHINIKVYGQTCLKHHTLSPGKTIHYDQGN